MRNCFLPSSNLKNIGSLMNRGGEKLKQAAKATEKMEPKIASQAEKFANKIQQNFTKDKLNTMAEKLGKYSDPAIAQIKKMASSLLDGLTRLLGVACEEIGKVMTPKNIGDFMAKTGATLKQGVKKMIEKMGPAIASTAEKFACGTRNFTEKYS